MEWNPYISGALTAIINLMVYHFLPKKLKKSGTRCNSFRYNRANHANCTIHFRLV